MRVHSKEEIYGILQTFPESYEQAFEEPLNLADVESFLISMLKKKKNEHIERAFSSLNTHSIRLMIDTINELKNRHIEEPKKKKVKK